jgi:histidyl-tRNA synthetase
MLQAKEIAEKIAPSVDVYVTAMGDNVELYGLQVAEALRDQLPGLKVQSHFGGGNFKKQMKRADKSGATLALVLGESELQDNLITVKYLREDKPQQSVSRDELAAFLAALLLA